VSAKFVRHLRKKSHLTRFPPGIAAKGLLAQPKFRGSKLLKEKNHDT
jgi:hypothetical protein